MSYSVAIDPSRTDGLTLLRIGFIGDAANSQRVPDALTALASCRLPGGRGLLFNGPASLPVAMALAHGVAHLYQFIACWDPKLQKYVVAVSHSPVHRPGDLLD